MSWILSYLLILLVPLGISLGVYASTLAVYTDEIDRSNAASLLQLRQSLDSYLQELEKLRLQIELNGSLAELIYARSPGDLTKNYAAMARVLEMNQSFRDLSLSNGFVKRILIVFRGIDQVWFDNGLYPRRDLVKRLFPEGSVDADAWLAPVTGVAVRSYGTLAYEEVRGQRTDGLALVHSIPFLDPDPAANIVIYIDETKFIQAAELARRSDGTIVSIADSSGRVLYSTDPTAPGLPADVVDRLGTEADQAPLTFRSEGRSEVISYIHSQVNDWTYLVTMPEALYTQRLDFLKTLIGIAVVLCLVLGAAAVVLLANRNYLPLQEVLGLVAPQRRQSVPGNEYEVISRSLALLRSQDEAVRGQFLLHLLKGRIPASEAEVQAETLGIVFRPNDMVVVLVHFEDGADPPSRIGDLFQGILGAEGAVWATESEGMPVLLVSPPPAEGGWVEPLRTSVRDLQETLRAVHGVECSLAVGGAHPLGDVALAFREALDTLEQRFFAGHGLILFHQDQAAPSPGLTGYAYSFETETKLSNLIGAGDAEGAWALVDELISRLSRSQIDAKLARCLLYDVVGTILKTLIVEGVGEAVVGTGAGGREGVIDRLMDFGSLDELKRRLKDLVVRACEGIRSRRKDRGVDQLVLRIQQEIEDVYQDPNLSLTLLAGKIGMNPKYLASLYKVHAGESMVDTIQKTRIRHAKASLANPRNTLAAVARKAG